MALRFRKSFKIAPGIKLNVSKRGLGMSAGVKGARIGVNSKGTYSSYSIPGTGISSFEYHKSPTTKTSGQNVTSTSTVTDDVPVRTITTKHKDNTTWWILGNGLLLLVLFPVGVITTIGSIVYYYINKDKPETLAKKNIGQGIRNVKAGNFPEAIPELTKASEVFPNDSGLKFYLAYSYAMVGHFDKALPLIRDYSAANSDDIVASLMLGICYEETKQYDNAIPLFQGLPNEPEYVKMQRIIHLAECFKQKRLFDAAMEVLKTAPLRRRNLDAELLEINYKIGEVLELQGKQKQAQKYWQKVYMHDSGYKDVAEKVTE